MSQPKDYLRDRKLEGPYGILDLQQEVAEVKEQAEKSGIGGKTLTKLQGLSVVVVHLREGKTLEEHSVDGPATVHVLEGRLELTVEGNRTVIKSDEIGVLEPGVPHDATAKQNTTILLTFNEKG